MKEKIVKKRKERWKLKNNKQEEENSDEETRPEIEKTINPIIELKKIIWKKTIMKSLITSNFKHSSLIKINKKK